VLEDSCDELEDDGDDVPDAFLCDVLEDDGDDVLDAFLCDVDSALLDWELSLPLGCTAMNAFETGCSLRLAAIDSEALDVGAPADAEDEVAAEVAAALDGEELELVASAALELDLGDLCLWLVASAALELDLGDLCLWLVASAALELDLGDLCLWLVVSVAFELDAPCSLDWALDSAALVAALACFCDAPCALVTFDGAEVTEALEWCFEPLVAFDLDVCAAVCEDVDAPVDVAEAVSALSDAFTIDCCAGDRFDACVSASKRSTTRWCCAWRISSGFGTPVS